MISGGHKTHFHDFLAKKRHHGTEVWMACADPVWGAVILKRRFKYNLYSFSKLLIMRNMKVHTDKRVI
jgi:hypothetical protein